MKLRPYEKADATYIRQWIASERVHAMWSAGKLAYGFEEKELQALLDTEAVTWHQKVFMAVSDEGIPIGSFCMNINKEDNSAFMCRIIVDGKERGKGYGFQMITEALQYAFHILKAECVRLSVFDCNMPARKTYEKAGFQEESFCADAFTFEGETWGRYILKAECCIGGKIDGVPVN